MVNDFVFELGCEELPSGLVWPLANEFANHLLTGLDKAGLSYGEVRRFATPRRIAIVILALQTEQKSQSMIRRGPAVVAAYDHEGKPTSALIGFAKSCGVETTQLTKIETDKGDWMVCETNSSGKQTKELIPPLIRQCLSTLPIIKPMRWGSNEEAFVRPVHWVLMLFGNDVIDYEFFGIKTNRQSRGHRFHHPQEITIVSAQSYESQMQEAFVIADFSARRQLIKEQIQELAQSYQAEVIMPEALLDEVTSIVEWPVALIAHFDEEFLEVPPEALIASMQLHQKTFALRSQQGKLLPHFISVANIASSKPQQVIQGNEKVMRARLSDAAFFFKEDKKQPLSQRILATEKVVFQLRLGSLRDKAQRVEKFMQYLSNSLSFSQQHAQRAAELSKCDLLTGMVGEFPELQGLMGYYYALYDGEDPSVAQVLNEQYMPRFALDSLPESLLGKALSLADRLDTLVGIFAIGEKPSGVKDPFKLRRNALAIVRLLISIPQSFHLTALINEVLQNYGDVLQAQEGLVEEIKTFIFERLYSYYQNLGIRADLVQAVRSRQDECLYDLDRRLHALKVFVTSAEAVSLSAACKRVNHLLSHAGIHSELEIDENYITIGAEEILYHDLRQVAQSVEPLYTAADYGSLLKRLASLKEPVDAFFDKVMVMVEEKAIRENRLALLTKLQGLLQGVADISMLQLT